MRIILLTSLLIMAFSYHSVTGQSISFEKECGVISHLIGEDQHGNQVKFQPPEEKPLVLFFLPKSESRKDAEWLMDHVTAFFESLSEYRSRSIKGILVVEPIRSGPLVNRIFRSRLSDKPFPVIRDTGGKITSRVHDETYSIMAWLVGVNGETIYKTTDPFSDAGDQKLKEKINEITNEGYKTLRHGGYEKE